MMSESIIAYVKPARLLNKQRSRCMQWKKHSTIQCDFMLHFIRSFDVSANWHHTVVCPSSWLWRCASWRPGFLFVPSCF